MRLRSSRSGERNDAKERGGRGTDRAVCVKLHAAFGPMKLLGRLPYDLRSRHI